MTDATLDTILNYVPNIRPLFADVDVTEIMVNQGGRLVFCERDGQVYLVDGLTIPESALRHAIRYIGTSTGRDVNEARPLLEARLADGARVAAALPPCGETSLTIRRFGRRFSLDDLVGRSMLSESQAGSLIRSIRRRENILIAGACGSGKTALANALIDRIPDGDRIVVIEDTREMHVTLPNVVRLEAREASADGSVEAVTIDQLLRHALRNRPDRIVIGEIRGVEAASLLDALNTGHRGTISTLHANSARDAILRFLDLVLERGSKRSERSILRSIGSVIHAVVYLDRDGSRRVVREVLPVDAGMVRDLLD